MGEKNCSSSNAVDADIDIDNKLKQYMQINKQISRTLTTQRVEIASLKSAVRFSESEIIRLRIECHKWKTKHETLSQMYIAHVQSVTKVLQSNTNVFTELSSAGNSESCSALTDQSVASSNSVSRNAADVSRRRVSKSFESAKNRSLIDRSRRNDESMHTIEEEDEKELSDSSNTSGSDTVIDNSKVESDEDSRDSSDEVVRELQTSNDILDESQLEEEDSRKIDEESDASGEESGASGEETGTRDEESGVSDEESGASNEESDAIDEESGAIDEESGATDEESSDSEEESGESEENNDESGESDEEGDGSNEVHDETDGESETSQENSVLDEHNEVDVINATVVNNGDFSGNESSSEAEESDAASNSNDSGEQSAILTANNDSTITNDDSDKENYTVNGSTSSFGKNTTSIISVDSIDTFDKSTSLKLKNGMSTKQKKGNASDQSISLSLINMEEQNLVSSTPYRNNNADGDASVDPTTASSQSNRSSTVSNTSQASTSSSSSSSIASGRPKRKAAPSVLSEPKLNTKLRRPR